MCVIHVHEPHALSAEVKGRGAPLWLVLLYLGHALQEEPEEEGVDAEMWYNEEGAVRRR